MINILLNLKNAPPASFKKTHPKDSSKGSKMSDTTFVSKYFKTVFLVLTVLFATNSLFAQPSRVEGTWVSGSYNSSIGTVSARTAINGTTVLAYRGQSTATSATRTLLFNGPGNTYNPKWVANNATPLAKNTRLSGGAVRFTSGGTDINFVTVQNSYYTLIIGNSNSTNNDLAIWETSYNPTTISSVSRNFSTVDATQSPTITVTMANALGTNERVYVYYSTDNFATSGNSAFVQLSALNGSFQGTASIPTFTAGTTVTYYVLTTANTTPTFANVQYQSLNIFNGTAQNTTAANFSYTVTAAGPTPTITLGTTSGTYNANVGATSGVQTSTVTGANLTANITVTAPAYYEVSSDGSTWNTSATFVQSGGNVSGTLSIRYKPTAVENAVAKTISLTSTGATTVNYTATGTAANSITVQFQQPGDWSGSGYLYAFNGGTLNPAGIGSGWPGLIMTSLGSGWWTYTFTYTNSTVDIIFNNGNNGKQTVNITGVNSSRCYTLTGTGTNYGVSLATCPSGPTIGVTPTTATYSTTVGGTSGSQTFAVSGSFLTADIVVTAPAYYQVSKDNSSWSATGGSVSYTPVSNSVSANLYVRYVPTGAESAVAKSVTLTSTGATGQNITVTGTTSSLKVSNAVTGLWTDGSSWVGGVAPLTIDVVQIVSGANITIASNFTQTGAITVDAGGKLTATSKFVTNTSVAINGTFTIGGSLNGGGGNPTVSGSGTWTYGPASTLEFRSTGTYNFNNGNGELCWPATNGPFNVSLITASTNIGGLQLNDGIARTINGTLLVQNTNNLYQNGIGGGYTVNGTVQINSNGVFGNNVVTYGASSTLLFNTGTTITSMSGPWVTGTGGPGRGLPANVQISNNTTLSIPNSANYTVKGNLTIDSGSAVNTPSANALTVSGSVLNSGTLTLGGSANGDINVGGNWTNSGTFTHNSRTVTFNGTGNQIVSKTGGESFQNLVVNKASGNVLLATSTNVTVSNTLALSAGEFVSGSNTLTLNGTITRIAGTLTTDNSSLVFGPNVAALTLPNSVFTSSPSSLVNLTVNRAGGITLGNQGITFSGALALTDGLVNTGSFAIIGTATSTTTVGTGWVNGNFRKFIPSGSTSRDFEIGSSTVYAPVSLTFAGTINASTGSITASTTDGDHPQIATSGFNASKTVNRYYTLTNDTAVPGLTSYSPTFTYVAGDNDVAATPADYLIRRYSGTWSTSSISGTPTNTSATTTGVTGFGDFAIGENKITPTVVVNLAPSYTYISDPQGPNSLSSPSSPVPTDVTYSYEGTGATVYGPSATRPENAGTYQVTATLNEDANYYAAAPVTENFTILQKELTLIDLGTNDKVYDATTAASFTIVPAGPGVPGTRLAGIIPGDTVGYTPAGYFFDGAAPVSNVGTWTIISTTTLNGAESANYFLTQPIFGAQKDITPLGLTVSGFTASNKPYDGNRDATVSVAGVSLVGVLGGESVTLDSSSVTGLFDTKDIGTGKTVTASGFFITGPDASNYALTQPTTTANITTVPLTITAEDISSCAGTFVTTGRTEFTRSVNIPGDITSVTLTPSPGDGSTPGDYTLTPSAAAGPGVGNYGPITYVAGTLHVNRTPTATIGGTATICLNEAQPSITFTGANGEGTVHYRFYYRLNGGAELFRDSDPGVSTASFLVSTTTTRTDTYTLTRVLDLNTGCEQAQTGSAVMTIGLCTQVRPLQCGLTLPALNTPIQASALPGATQYRFEVTRIDTNTVYPLITVPTYLFNPSTQIPGGFLYGKSYSIRVQVFIGSWLAYGNACTVTAPSTPPVAPTKIRSFQCGATLLTVDTSIEAVPVYLATQYQFEVTPQGGSAVVVTTPNYYFTLTGTASLAAYSKAYAVRVNTLSGGNWTGFGDTCIVTTPARPTTKLVTAQCGATFNNLTFTLNSSNVPLVTKYRFRVVNGLTTRIAEVSRNYIIPSDLAGGYSNNTVYTVDVATLYNGLWSGYGPACTVTTPFIRMAAQDINTNVFEVKAFPNPFARHFSLDIQSSSDDLVQVQVYDMIGRELEVQNATVSELSTKEIGTNYPSGVYNVVVSQGDKVRSVRMIKR